MIEKPTVVDENWFYLLRKKHAENLIVTAFRKLREEGIEPVLIKGWAAARNYPESVPRFSGDIDLAVADYDFEPARTAIASKKIGGVDLHRELRHLDTVSWDTLIESSVLVELDGSHIRILSPEDHLRVMCVHWLTNGGENRERLWDIVHAVRNRPAEFDWSRCLNVVSRTRQIWIVTTIAIAHKYLGLELDGLPFAEEAAKPLPAWITRTLESEWSRKLELRALESQLKNWRSLVRQIRKRIPPNPIQATIDCEGEFDESSRVGYQIRNMIKRLPPAAKRISAVLMGKE